MRERMLIAVLAALLPVIAAAQNSGKYQCTYGDMLRRVEIAHEPGVEVPCSVHYYKDTEMPGEQQVLWSADSDANYCAEKAAEFVAKLEGWGWDCGMDAETSADEGAADEQDVEETGDEQPGEPEVPSPPDQMDID